jgi:hypothetical protein
VALWGIRWLIRGCGGPVGDVVAQQVDIVAQLGTRTGFLSKIKVII